MKIAAVACDEAESRGVAQLTGLPVGGGCAAKYPAARLEELLRGFVPAESENLLVGLSPADDAAVYRLDDERALVFTVDFFPPLVDDPADFGAIAATNALNDVFAMGGTPLLALSIAAFPEELPVETLGAILAGAEEQVRAAGALLAGGHTIRDDGAEVRPRRRRNGAPGRDLAEVGRAAGRRAAADEAARHRARARGVNDGQLGADERAEAIALMRTLNRRGGRRAAAVRAERRHRRHRLRPLRPRARAGRAERRRGRPRRRAAARAHGRDRGRARRRPHRRRPAQPRVRRAARHARRRAGGAGGARLRPADRGRPAGVAARPSASPVLEAELAARGLFVARIGTVEQGSGVHVAASGLA